MLLSRKSHMFFMSLHNDQERGQEDRLCQGFQVEVKPAVPLGLVFKPSIPLRVSLTGGLVLLFSPYSLKFHGITGFAYERCLFELALRIREICNILMKFMIYIVINLRHFLAMYQLTHVTEGHPQGEACLYKHFGGVKAVLCYVNHQDIRSAAG